MGVSDGSVVGIVKVIDNGPDTDNWNLVITGDGFVQDELSDFATAVDTLVTFMQTQSPFDNALVWSMINIYRLDVASNESGTDNINCASTTVATYFDSTICANGVARTMRIDAQLVKDTADDQLPDWDALLVMVNTTDRGGTTLGGVAIRTLSSDVNEGCLHELGHAAFGFADEYPYSLGCGKDDSSKNVFTGSEPVAPNVTISTSLATLKWASLVDPATPLPTLANPDCTQCPPTSSTYPAGTVGLFEGASHHHCGVYRAELDCRMNHAKSPYCAACSDVILNTIFAAAPVCWVATAVYGDPLHPDVMTLRRWRDRHLAQGARGATAMRLLAAGYARVGPPLARFTQPRPRLARLLRTGVFRPLTRVLRRSEGKLRLWPR